ncbi:MAG: 3-deoxy-7-phosphoheptulonate synthase [Acholeplasmataceae bacterium]|jgi:3-deoxy-7-phosphoheptulonate synthase
MDNLKIYKKQKDHKTIVKVKDVTFNDGSFNLIAGPCSIESYESLDKTAGIISKNGGKLIRGGTFKLRTSPYSFEGLGKEAIDYLHKIGKKYNLITVSEIPSILELTMFIEKIDIIQVGARNMNNFPLLKALGKTKKPVILKRGSQSTIEEWLLAAEHILNEGNDQIILCERGSRSFETYTRNTLDLSAALAAKKLTHLPVIIDPSHGTGRADMVSDFTKVAKFMKFDGALIEIHENPETALSDGFQTIDFDEYEELVASL